MPPVPLLRSRRGFTLLELAVSMVLMMVIVAIAVQTFRRSSVLLAQQSGSLEALANARFGLTSIDRDLRVAGTGTTPEQPILVQASNTAITFNVDLISRVTGDPFAAFYDASADSNTTSAMRSTASITLPNSSFTYPDSTYYQTAGILGGAETISYYLVKDSTTSLSTEYILFRRVNATTPRAVARGIQYSPGDTVFQYFRVTAADSLAPVPTSALPTYHYAAVHGSAADTGIYALVDSIRAVRVTLKAVYHDPRQGDVLRPLSTTVNLLNAGLNSRSSCGQAPSPVTPTTSTSLAGAAAPWIKISWAPSADDGGGENDIYRYIIYRRPASATSFTQPYSAVPAGSSTYSFTDNDVAHGDAWIYGVASQDCTPATSTVSTTGAVFVP